MAKEPYNGYDALPEEQVGYYMYNQMQSGKYDRGQMEAYLEEIAEYEEAHQNRDGILDYIDDWLDWLEGITDAPTMYTKWANSKTRTQPNTKLPPRNALAQDEDDYDEVDEYEERFTRIEGQLKAIHEYLRRSQGVDNWADRANLFTKFNRQFEIAGTEAEAISKAVSDLQLMAMELAPKIKSDVGCTITTGDYNTKRCPVHTIVHRKRRSRA